jgi:NAD(P)-dependent dehydrogenase (short-subunit alcohol dehydrogenase family)
VRAITSWLDERIGTRPTSPAGQPAASEASAQGSQPAEKPRGKAPTRYVTSYLPDPLAKTRARKPLAGRTIGIVTETAVPAVADPIVDRLRALGAEVAAPTQGTDPPADSRDVVYLGGWGEDDGTLALPEACDGIRSLLREGPRVLLAVIPLTERAAGLRGMFRSIAREYPRQVTRVIEVDPRVADGDVANAVAAELVAAGSESPEPDQGAIVCRYTPKGRDLLQLVASPLGNVATSGAGPAGAGSAEAAAIGLTPDSVVLLIGGARGITAGFTTLLASAAGCRLELVGRSCPPVGVEDPRTAGAVDERQLRQAVIGLGVRNPREVQRAVRNLLAEREIRATLASVARHGGTARYHQADALDAGAVRKIVERLLAEYGRLDGVVFAAGVIDDRLLAEKDLASFQRVFDPKVAGARSLLATLADLTARPQFVTLFGSIAGVVGNRGQSDYAAANDALETLGSAWSQRTGVRSLTVHWGPWAPSRAHQGMVSPSLEEEFTRRGIELIDQEEGHQALLRELAWGSRDQRAVVYTAGGWSASPKGGRS